MAERVKNEKMNWSNDFAGHLQASDSLVDHWLTSDLDRKIFKVMMSRTLCNYFTEQKHIDTCPKP